MRRLEVVRKIYFDSGILFSFANLTASAAALAITADLPAPAVPMISSGAAGAAGDVT